MPVWGQSLYRETGELPSHRRSYRLSLGAYGHVYLQHPRLLPAHRSLVGAPISRPAVGTGALGRLRSGVGPAGSTFENGIHSSSRRK